MELIKVQGELRREGKNIRIFIDENSDEIIRGWLEQKRLCDYS